MKCPRCHRGEDVVCHGRRYAMYPSGCVALLGPFLAILHQASVPFDYECKACDLKFSRRRMPAKVALIGILLFVGYLIWITVGDISSLPEP